MIRIWRLRTIASWVSTGASATSPVMYWPELWASAKLVAMTMASEVTAPPCPLGSGPAAKSMDSTECSLLEGRPTS